MLLILSNRRFLIFGVWLPSPWDAMTSSACAVWLETQCNSRNTVKFGDCQVFRARNAVWHYPLCRHKQPPPHTNTHRLCYPACFSTCKTCDSWLATCNRENAFGFLNRQFENQGSCNYLWQPLPQGWGKYARLKGEVVSSGAASRKSM